MNDFYYLLEQISVEVPKTYLQYLDFWPCFAIIFIAIISILLIKYICKKPNQYLKLKKISIAVFAFILLGNITFQTAEYLYKKNSFEKSKIRSDYLRKVTIYSVLKDRPYTLIESHPIKTNDENVLSELSSQFLLNNEHRRNFHLVRNILLNIQKNSNEYISFLLNQSKLCTKDAINDLYQCFFTFYNPIGAEISVKTLVYTNPKDYQDYLIRGFNKTTYK